MVRLLDCSKESVQVYSTERKLLRLPTYTLFVGQNCSGFVNNVIDSWDSKLDPSNFVPNTWYQSLIDNLADYSEDHDTEEDYCFEYGSVFDTGYTQPGKLNSDKAYTIVFEYDCEEEVINFPEVEVYPEIEIIEIEIIISLSL